MTQQFHEGQEVEVAVPGSGKVWKSDQTRRTWRKAKIVRIYCGTPGTMFENRPLYHVNLSDGTRDVFDAEHIRAIDDHAARMLIRDRQNNPYDDASFDSAEYDLQARR